MKRANDIRYLEYVKIVKIERRLQRKILKDPGPKPATPEATAENLLGGAEQLRAQQERMTEATTKLLVVVSEVRGGPWGGGSERTEEDLIKWLGVQDDRVDELQEKIVRRARELVRLAEVEGDDQRPAIARPKRDTAFGGCQVSVSSFRGGSVGHRIVKRKTLTEKLLRRRLIETDGIIEGSSRQESSSHEASTPRSFISEVPTSAETRGKAQEAHNQVAQEGEELKTRLKEVQQEGRGEEEVTKRSESLDLEIPSRRNCLGEQQGKPARGRSLGRKLESDLQPREAALRPLPDGARERQDNVAGWGRESQGVFLAPSRLKENLQGKATRTEARGRGGCGRAGSTDGSRSLTRSGRPGGTKISARSGAMSSGASRSRTTRGRISPRRTGTGWRSGTRRR